jgi:hypothetical protein
MLLAALLLAQTTPCTAMDANLPAPLAAWVTPGQGLPGDDSRPIVFKSLDPANLETPGKQSEPAQTGGVVRYHYRITKPGIYGIALDQPGWIELAPKGGAALASVQHGHGPECSTIRKIVRFDLKAGDYTLTLTKLTKPQAKVMLVAP